ncbi:hypothetical protein XENOCAPTIV_015862, partial [Xenoophorus captivus]
QFNINTYAPTMLLFKEDTEKPVDIIQARGMKKQLMDEFVSNNKFLQVPRLINQQLFDELYCVLLITGEDEAFLPGNKAFVDFATVNKKDVLRFAYVYQRQQQPLCQALLHTQAATFPQVSSPTKSVNVKDKMTLFFPSASRAQNAGSRIRFLVSDYRHAMSDVLRQPRLQ